MRQVYLAGPITGLTYDGATDWRRAFTHEVRRRMYQWHCLSPMRAKEEFRLDGPLPSTFDEGKPAVMRDLMDIRRSDVVLVNLLGATSVSVGTMCELGYAFAKECFVLVVMDPEQGQLRPVNKPRKGAWYRDTDALPDALPLPASSGYEYERYDPHDHVFVTHMASQIVPSLDRALSVLEHL